MSDVSNTNYSRKDIIQRLSNKSKVMIEYFQLFYHGFLVPFFFLLIFQVYRTNITSFKKLLPILVRVPLIVGRMRQTTKLASYQYPIFDKIESTTTQIFFAHSKLTGIVICMKLWPKRKIEDSNAEDPTIQLRNMLEGFTFNQRFAPGVYLGIAPVFLSGEKPENICRGDLIFKPSIYNLKPGEYVIVMRDIQKEWKLDYRLLSERDNLRTRKGMEFLAKQVAYMHKQLKPVSQEKNQHDIIAEKLAYNSNRLRQAIQKCGDAEMKEKYDYIYRVMYIALGNYTSYFDQRCREGHIKRCHGDLKTTNLWVIPWKILPRKLFFLDCIDFNSDFCQIDTLSDIAMLAVDCQQVLSGLSMNDAEELTKHFLNVYRKEMQENDVCVQPLLTYYMTEKAMVCSYVSMLLDRSPELGKRYFSIAYLLAQQLEHLFVPAIPTSPLETGLAMLSTSM